MNTPLSVAIERAKAYLFDSLNTVIAETKLPAYLLDGILMELVAEVRQQKNRELLADLAAANNGAEDAEQTAEPKGDQ